jgi:hypothetical protein
LDQFQKQAGAAAGGGDGEERPAAGAEVQPSASSGGDSENERQQAAGERRPDMAAAMAAERASLAARPAAAAAAAPGPGSRSGGEGPRGGGGGAGSRSGGGNLSAAAMLRARLTKKAPEPEGKLLLSSAALHLLRFPAVAPRQSPPATIFASVEVATRITPAHWPLAAPSGASPHAPLSAWSLPVQPLQSGKPLCFRWWMPGGGRCLELLAATRRGLGCQTEVGPPTSWRGVLAAERQHCVLGDGGVVWQLLDPRG